MIQDDYSPPAALFPIGGKSTTSIETHLGGGAIMKRNPPALHSIGIDLNPRALARFECDYPVEKIHGCAHRFLAEYAFEGRELIHCDPPYLKHTRSSARRYRFDYERGDHIELLRLLKALPCQVILCGTADGQRQQGLRARGVRHPEGPLRQHPHGRDRRGRTRRSLP